MKFHIRKLNQYGFDHVVGLVMFVVAFALIGSWFLFHSLAASAPTYVLLHIGSYSGSCVNGTTLVNCNTSGTSSEQTWDTISGGSMPSLEGSNFHIENRANQCIQNTKGPKGNYVGSNSSNRVYLSVGGCSSSNRYQEWNWSNHRLVNSASGGCINSLGNAETPNTDLLVYTCNSGNNEEFFDKSVSVPSSGGGGGSTGGSAEQSALCKQFGFQSGSAKCNNIGTAINFMGSAGSGYGSWANSTQEECLGELWNRESGWNNYIMNANGENSSLNGAFGIAQALGHGGQGTAAKTTVHFLDGKTITGYVNQYSSYDANAGVALYQIIWGLNYIKTNASFNTPCSAWTYDAGHGYYVVVGTERA